MKKYMLVAAALTLTAAAHATVVSGFTGPFAPGNWTPSIDGNGSITASAGSVSLTTASDDAGTDRYTDFTIPVGVPSTITFDWDFSTQDDPFFERFGFLLDGVFNELSDPFGGNGQAGSHSVFVDAGQIFGFRGWSLDGVGDPSTTRVSNFSANQVPEPATYALVALLLAGVAASRRRPSNH